MSDDHDTGYKLLFAHPEMVRDLLIGYVPGECIAGADFATLERINASYVSETLKQRHDDIVWRVRLKDRWLLWVYLVLEFQSEPDPWMALRMLVYVGLLAQDLVKRGDLADDKLPPIFTLVLYNRLPQWNVARNVDDLFAPSPRANGEVSTEAALSAGYILHEAEDAAGGLNLLRLLILKFLSTRNSHELLSV